MTDAITDDRVRRWLDALEARHLADLRVSEVTRALRALSSAYVERREPSRPSAGGARARQVRGALDTAGKRAAFAIFYGPLHFMTVCEVVQRLDTVRPAPSSIIDIGCGTGVAGAAWALCGERPQDDVAAPPELLGVDVHPWAVAETRWTYAQLGVRGRAQHGDLARLPRARPDGAIVAAYVLNEMPDGLRRRVENWLFESAAAGARAIVLEPIARRAAPWWDAMAARARRAGGRADEWRLPVDLPPMVKLLDKAAGLDHRELTVRSLVL